MHTTTTFGSQLPIYLPPLESITKRALVSDIARTFDALGLFSPSIIKAKILLQRLWEQKIDWDDAVPESIREAWSQMAWRSELNMLTEKRIPRCYFPKEAKIISTQLHGFSDASELAYAGAVYLRMCDSEGNVHGSLVTSKTKVAPIKRLTIPRLELCGAHLLAQLLHHVREALHVHPRMYMLGRIAPSLSVGLTETHVALKRTLGIKWRA